MLEETILLGVTNVEIEKYMVKPLRDYGNDSFMECDYDAVHWTFDFNITNNIQEDDRITFMFFTVLLFVVSIVGNLAAIYVAVRMNHRVMYKQCLVSLAISDLCMTLTTGTNNMMRYTQPWIDWALGDFMCSFIPMVQTMCVLGSSMTLTCVALDRYQCVINALRGRWDPNALICAACMGAIWLSAAGVSVPMYLAYDTYELNVIVIDLSSNILVDCQQVDLCISKYKSRNFTYFITVFTLIFLPLFCTFLAIHGLIAHQIWKRRTFNSSTPQSTSAKTQTSVTQTAQPQEEPSKNKKKNVEAPKFIYTSKMGWNSFKNGSSSDSSKIGSCSAEENSKSRKDIKKTAHMVRKIRTFKIIITVMVVFFVCRLPSWIFLLITSSNSQVGVGETGWLIHYSFSTLTLLNSALNPFLYGFLNEFLNMRRQFCSWMEESWSNFKEWYSDRKARDKCDIAEHDSDACKGKGTSIDVLPRSPFSYVAKRFEDSEVLPERNVVEDYGGVYPFQNHPQ